MTDKAQKTVLGYDGRGRVTGRLKRVALVDPANPARTLGLARRGYLQEIAYDEANRVVTEIAYADAARTWGRNGLAEWTKTRAHSLALHDEGRANHAPQALPVHSNPKGY